jgi:carotenoid 1,2-hydratase
VGSVFSPYYKRARSRGLGQPNNHCAINVALYGPIKRWAMTERGSRHVLRKAEHFRVGPSSIKWENDDLVIDLNERCMPLPYRLRGHVRLTPGALHDGPIALDDYGKHFWQAVAPHARLSVELDYPKLNWSGLAYHDINWGEEPLENGFRNWTWARAKTLKGTQVLYDVERRDGSRFSFGRRYFEGEEFSFEVPPVHQLMRGLWGMAREVHSEAAPRLIEALEDAPFYTRNHIEMVLGGEHCQAVHESLSLDRFVRPVVQFMLPFRMPRVG